jgi:hypothetical protein
MIKMKSLLLLLILVLAAACTEQKAAQTGAPVADNEENRLAAAKEYLKISPPKDLLHDITSGVTEKMPEQLRKPFTSVISSQALQDAAYQIALKALVKHYNVNEIKAMIAFYSTPQGKAILRKEGAYKNEVIGGINMELMTAFKKAVEEQKATAPQEQKPPEPKAAPESKATPAPKAAPETKAQPAPPSPKPVPPAAK